METDSFNIQRSFNIAKEAVSRRWWIVLATCMITIGLVIAYMRMFQPVYEGSALVLVEQEKDTLRDQFYSQWSIFRKGEEVATEAELIKISPVVEEVVKHLNLKYEDVYHPLLRQIADIWSQSRIGRTYKRIKCLFFPPKKSPWDPSPEEIELAKTVNCFQSGIIVKPVGNSMIGEIIVRGPTKRVAEMANILVDVYLEQRRERHWDEAMAAYRSLTPQVERALANLREVERNLQEFADRYGVHFELDKERADVKVLSSQEAEWLKIKASIVQFKARLTEVNRQLAEQSQMKTGALQVEANELKIKVKDKLMNNRITLLEMRNRFVQDAPEVQEIEQNIRNLEELLQTTEDMVLTTKQEVIDPVWQNLNQEHSSILVTLRELQKAETEQRRIIDHYTSELVDLPEKQRQLISLTRALALADEEYRILLGKQRQAFISGLTETKGTASLKVVERAFPPEKPKRPKSKLYLAVALFLGLLLGGMAAFIADLVDEKIYNPVVMESIMEAPIYAVLTLPLSRKSRYLPRFWNADKMPIARMWRISKGTQVDIQEYDGE